MTQYDYKPCALFAGLQPDPASGIVGAGVPFPIWVVAATRATDGLCVWPGALAPAIWSSLQTNQCLSDGNDLVQVYDYKKGAFDGPEREFRGFGEVTISDAPIGIGGVQRQSFYQDDYRKGKLKQSESFAGSVSEPVVAQTTFDWQSVGTGVRKQIYLREQKVESFPVYTSGGSLASYPSQCVVHRNSIALSNGSTDPQTRIQSACSMACSGAGQSSDGCNVNVVGQKTVETTYATPVGNALVEVWDRPATLTTHYRESSTSLKLTSEREFYYDGLDLNQVQRGLPTRERQHLTTTPNEWSDKVNVYDNASGVGPGNLTSVKVFSSVARDPQMTTYDDEFHLFPRITTLPKTGSSYPPTTHVIERTFDYRFGAVTSTIGVLGAGAGDVSGTTFDTLGRPTCKYQPGTICGANGTGGVVEYQYQFGNPSASSIAQKLNAVSARRKEPNSPTGYLTSTTYWDALGRARFTTNEQLNSATNSIATAVVSHITYGFHGKPWKSYEPYWLTGSLSLTPPSGLASSETSYVLNGNSGGRLDPAGRVYKVKQFDGAEPSTLYLGRTVEAHSPVGDLTRSVVDEHGRVITRETFNQSGGTALTRNDVVYDGGDRVVEEKFGGDDSTKIIKTYDLAGRLIQAQDPDSGTWTKKYDIAGNLLFADDPNTNQSIQLCYDQHDRVVLECGRPSDTYDGSLCANPNPSCARQQKYTYDETSNISGATNLGKGRLTTVAGSYSSHKYLYDVRGRATSQQDTAYFSLGETKFEYRPDIDRVLYMTYPDGERVKYDYDIAGQPKALSQVSGTGQWLAWYVMDVKYDIRGRATFVQRGNYTTDTMTYHGASEGFQLATSKSERVSGGPTDPGDVFVNLSYSDYDANGRIKTISDQRWNSGLLSMTSSYLYDGAGRLTSSEVVGQKAHANTTQPETFQYNSIGNMTQKNGFALTYGQTGKPHRATAVLTSASSSWGMSYDNNGQRIAKTDAPSTTSQAYFYNAFGDLERIEINGTTNPTYLGYDYRHRRVYENRAGVIRRVYNEYSESLTDGQLLIKYYYLGGQAVATRADNVPWMFAGGTPPAPPIVIPPEFYWGVMGVAIVLLVVPIRSRRTQWAFGATPSGAVGAAILLLAVTMPLGFSTGCTGDAPIRHLHMGHLGGPLAISTVSGSVDRLFRYSAYGEVRRYNGSGVPVALDKENRREYTGYDTHAESGLEYAGLRFYDPTVATFTAHDPAEQVASPYAYVAWDPINRIDPSGAVSLQAYMAIRKGNAGVFFGGLATKAASDLFPTGTAIYNLHDHPRDASNHIATVPILGALTNSIRTLATRDDKVELAQAGVGAIASAVTVGLMAYGLVDSLTAEYAGPYRIATIEEIFGTTEIYAQYNAFPPGFGEFRLSLLANEWFGGHVMDLHVAKQVSFLLGRLTGETPAASSFYSLRQASSVINAALGYDAASIRSWLAQPDKSWMTSTVRMNKATGFRVQQGVRGVSHVNSVFYYLRKSAIAPQGFIVYTAYPVP